MGKIEVRENRTEWKQAESQRAQKPLESYVFPRAEEPLFFANCERISQRVPRSYLAERQRRASCHHQHERVTGYRRDDLESFESFFRFIREQKKYLILARLKGPVYELLRKIVPETDMTVKQSYLSVDDAVSACRVG